MISTRRRAKAVDGGEWVYGYFLTIPELPIQQPLPPEELDPATVKYKSYILPEGYEPYLSSTGWEDVPKTEVDTETVCQYLGALGNNECDVYEGDFITATIYPYNEFNGLVDFDNDKKMFTTTFYRKSDMSNTRAIFQLMTRDLSYLENANLAVLGNKFDNPELITK